jgi:hypothetical protein
MAKKKQTYADRAKAIMNKYKTRLGEKFDKGDVLALEAMNQELQGLQRKQEKERIQKLIEGANDEQISQLSQALQGGGQGQPQQQQQQQGLPQQGAPQQQFQPQQNQGPQQPGIPQGGPSGLAGGQQAAPPQIAGQSPFATGGKLPQYQGPGINPNFLNAQNYTPQLAAKVVEATGGMAAVHQRVAYTEQFQPFFPEVYHHLPVSDHNLRLSEELSAEGNSRVHFLAPYVDEVMEDRR